jgi:hypothetical protein
VKVGDLVKINNEELDWDFGRIILLLECLGVKSYNLGKEMGKLFTGMTNEGIGEYYVFEPDAEVISESR